MPEDDGETTLRRWRRGLRNALWPSEQELLPPTIAARIWERDRSSELIMRLVQLCIVAAFAILYLLSPRTDGGTRFSLVPTVLAIYLILTLIGLLWSARSEIPDWGAYLSVVFDISLLVALIWSFHIQYDQPPSFYLKAPTFLYFFIFIALRALRFDPKFLIASGVASIVGWLALVAYVVVGEGSQRVVTRSYVDYLTGNALLVGAEVDKLLSVTIVAGILYVVLRRSRSLLIEAVREQRAASNLSRFFDKQVAARIRLADDLSEQGLRREAAVLFVDIRGFTSFSAALEPNEVIRVIAEYQRRIAPIIRAHGGIIDKFIGDGIMATFGAVDRSRTYAADALHAVDAIVTEVERWPRGASVLRDLPDRSVGAAVAVGTIVVGTIGDADRLEFTVIGGAVNLAAKLEALNKRIGSRALSPLDTYRTAVAQGYADERKVREFRSSVDGVEGDIQLAMLHA